MQWADKAIISPPLTAQVYLITQSLPLSWHQHMMQSDAEQRRAFSQPASWRHLFPNQTSEPNLLCCLDSLSEEWGERSVGWNRNGFCGVNRGLCECLHVWAEQGSCGENCWVMLWRASNCGAKVHHSQPASLSILLFPVAVGNLPDERLDGGTMSPSRSV